MNENTTFDSSDFRNVLPRFTPEALKANQALINLLRTIAERKKATPAQIALAWLLAQKPCTPHEPGLPRIVVRISPRWLPFLDIPAQLNLVWSFKRPMNSGLSIRPSYSNQLI